MDPGEQLTGAGRPARPRWPLAAAVAILAMAAVALLVVHRLGDDRPAGADSSASPVPPEAGPLPVATGASSVLQSPVGPQPPAAAADTGLVVLRGPAPVDPEVRARVQREAQQEVARLQEAVRTACAEAIAEPGAPSVLTVNLSLDASGRESGRSVTTDLPLSDALRTCILVTDAGGLRVEAPGVPLSARVRMELP